MSNATKWSIGLVYVTAALLAFGLANAQLRSDELPEYLKLVTSPAQAKPPDPSEVAAENVLALNKAMMPIYSNGLKEFQKNILAQRPVIIALFTGAGGEMTLYLPGKEPITAESPPIAYQFAKSCGHSAMAMYPLTVPYLNSPQDKSWLGPMRGFLAQNQKALATLKDLKIGDKDRRTLGAIIAGNIAFMQTALKNERVTLDELEAFTKKFKPLAEEAIWIAANAQVSHWMKVLDGWKKMVGKDWDNLLAATNTIYVTRQNNILFSILVQYMGREAIHRRLLLFETTDFFTTKEDMLSLLTRIVADRSLGQIYFNDYYLMDYELLGSGARRAIQEQCQARGMKPILPTMSPFNSTEWPWRTDPRSGTGPATLEEVK
ncbi:MAG: hypothetical protein AB7K24_22435 [Gemmataceae bacterium]